MIDNEPKEESNQSTDGSSKLSDIENQRTSEQKCDIKAKFRLKEESEEVDCPICISRIEEIAYTDSCFHYFCRKCIEKWSHSHNKCPMCRQTYFSILHNVRSNTEFERIQLSKLFNINQMRVILVDGNVGLLFTPVDSGVYMVNSRQTPHGIQQNILFLASSQSFVIQNLGTDVTFVRPEELDYVLYDLNEIEAVGQVGHHNPQAIPVSMALQPREDSRQYNSYNN